MEKKNKRKKKIDIDKIINFRFTLFLILIILLFAILFLKITSVMVVDKKEYSQKLKKITFTEVSGSSSPRGRIYDRNYNIIVDNKAVKTVVYKKEKGTSDLEMIEVATKVDTHLELD